MLRAVRGEIDPAHGRVFVDDLRKVAQPGPLGAETFGGQTRAFLKIQEGCDLFCTFCIVPFARGRSRSVEPRRVLSQLEHLSGLGFQEVVLTGIHLGGYGEDLHPRVTLADLVEMIAERRPVARVRLSSVDPPEVSARLLAVMARSDVLCSHLHMPVQSATDTVLRRMRRRYDSALVTDVLAEIARTLPVAGLGTDLIAGFPGESEGEFAEGYERLVAAPFTYFHVFPYSRRRGTTAAKMRDTVPTAVIAERARTLRRLGASKRRAFAARWVGRDAAVLFEHARDRASGHLVGYSREYVRVTVDGPDDWINREITVRVHRRDGDRAVGDVHTPPACDRADAIRH
jgi:threonylcarbamoyladenosine tRNA methylthiotransferase MtaB